jgi:hypothetical protein
MIFPLLMLALDSDVCPTSVPSPVAPLNTYTFQKEPSQGSTGAPHMCKAQSRSYVTCWQRAATGDDLLALREDETVCLRVPVPVFVRDRFKLVARALRLRRRLLKLVARRGGPPLLFIRPGASH